MKRGNLFGLGLIIIVVVAVGAWGYGMLELAKLHKAGEMTDLEGLFFCFIFSVGLVSILKGLGSMGGPGSY